jgi:hypothetical protein
MNDALKNRFGSKLEEVKDENYANEKDGHTGT